MSMFMRKMRGKLLVLGGGLLLLVSMNVMAQVTYVYTDPQGTPLAEADVNGNITATFDYAPYGSIALGTAPNGPGYTGHVNDPDTGLVYMQARYYDPATGRFLSTDPVGPSAGALFGFNRYDYANNNPIVNMDADGRCTGSLNQDSSGNCADSGTSVASSGPSLGGVVQAKQQQSGAKQVMIGLAKPVMNLLNDFAAAMGDSEASGTPDSTPSNQSQAVGMMISGPIVGAVEAAATDGNSVEIQEGGLLSASRAVYKTSSEATAAASELGFVKISERVHGQAVYQRGGDYITRDVDGHNGGAWKMASSPKALRSKATRAGTFDKNLNKIGP